MTTRLQIARARVSLANLSGKPLADTVRAIAAVNFADADAAIPASEPRNAEAPSQGFSFARLVGVHAGGHYFGLRHHPPRLQTGRGLTEDERVFLMASLHSGDERAAAEVEVARRELDDLAFVCDGELRFPAWQFTDDPERPTLDHLSWLTPCFGAMRPASILGFMTTPHSYTLIDGRPATPVEWLTARRDVQPLLDLLETGPST